MVTRLDAGLVPSHNDVCYGPFGAAIIDIRLNPWDQWQYDINKLLHGWMSARVSSCFHLWLTKR